MNLTCNKTICKTLIISILFLAVLSVFSTAFASAYKIEEGKVGDKMEKCTIDIKYPIMKDFSNSKTQDKINKIFKDYANDLFKEFTQAYKKDEKDIIRPWNLTTVYEIKYSDDNVLCIVLFSGYFYGGAHPNPGLDTFVFSLKQGKQYELKDMFKPGSKYLEKLATYCKEDLTKRKVSDEEWIESGTKPDEVNYRYFYVNEKGLVIIFPQYQVAPYAWGPQETTVPYKYLKDILNPNAPIIK